MDRLFDFLILASLLLLVVGIFKPTISLFWDKNSPTRKKSLLIYGGLTILFFIAFGVTTDRKRETNIVETKTENSKPTEPSETKQKQEPVEKTSLFENPKDLILKLSENGIGELKEWKNPFDMGWGSLTDYYQFGPQNNGVGMQNNICYYIEGTEKKATKMYINLNINNTADKKNALKFFNEISEKTFKTLNITIPKELTNAILNSKQYKTEIDGYKISNELVKSKIETWKVNIERQ